MAGFVYIPSCLLGSFDALALPSLDEEFFSLFVEDGPVNYDSKNV